MTNELTTKQPGQDLEGTHREPGATFTPRVDILENENELVLYADLPGVMPESVDVRFENGELVLHGHCAPRQNGVRYLRTEYGVGDFYRAFTITADVDPDKIAAELKNGVLAVHLPKSEKVKPKKIEVRGQ